MDIIIQKLRILKNAFFNVHTVTVSLVINTNSKQIFKSLPAESEEDTSTGPEGDHRPEW